MAVNMEITGFQRPGQAPVRAHYTPQRSARLWKSGSRTCAARCAPPTLRAPPCTPGCASAPLPPAPHEVPECPRHARPGRWPPRLRGGERGLRFPLHTPPWLSCPTSLRFLFMPIKIHKNETHDSKERKCSGGKTGKLGSFSPKKILFHGLAKRRG